MKSSTSLVASIGLVSSGLAGAEFDDTEMASNIAEQYLAQAEMLEKKARAAVAQQGKLSQLDDEYEEIDTSIWWS